MKVDHHAYAGALCVAIGHSQFRATYPSVDLHLYQGTSEQIAEMAALDRIDFAIATGSHDLFRIHTTWISFSREGVLRPLHVRLHAIVGAAFNVMFYRSRVRHTIPRRSQCVVHGLRVNSVAAQANGLFTIIGITARGVDAA